MDYMVMVVMFFFALLSLACLGLRGWLIPFCVGMFTVFIGAIATGATYSGDIVFSPYSQVFVCLVGSLVMLVSAFVKRNEMGV